MVDYNARLTPEQIAQIDAGSAEAWRVLRAEVATYKGLPCNHLPKPFAKPLVCSSCRLVMHEYPGLQSAPLFLLIERAWLCFRCWERALPEQAARWQAMWSKED